MMRVRLLLASLLILTLSAPNYANEAKAAYKRGVRAESQYRRDLLVRLAVNDQLQNFEFARA